MAPDGSQGLQKRKKKSIRKVKDEEVKDEELKDEEVTDEIQVNDEVQVNIERLTAGGYAALRQGDFTNALDTFKRAYKAATKVRNVMNSYYTSSASLLLFEAAR